MSHAAASSWLNSTAEARYVNVVMRSNNLKEQETLGSFPRGDKGGWDAVVKQICVKNTANTAKIWLPDVF